MPNHVTTIIRANTTVLYAMLTEEGVDFNLVIPMPEDVIRGSIGDATIDGVRQKVYYPPTEDDPLGVKTKPVPYPEGAIDWYEWSIQNWGTKWNAYSTQVLENERVVKFDTAWAHPFPVIIAHSKAWPDYVMEVAFADEDLGQNMGAYRILDGEITELPFPPAGSEAAVNLASTIKYGVPYEDLESGGDAVLPSQMFNQLVANKEMT